MNINELLNGRKCECGRTHTCAIKHIAICEGATEKLAEMTNGYKNILITADKNTYRVCGEKVKSVCAGKTEEVFVFDDEGILVPNEIATEKLKSRVSEKTDLIIGIGSGVIQDLCKYVSYLCKLPYFIVATAPSMDGYASVGAAMIAGNMKVTYSAHVPEAIIGDVDVLKNAPMDLIKSGYGDILGKYSCLNDWKLSALVNGEYFCNYVYDLTYDMLLRTKGLGEKLLKRDAESIKTLMEALVGVGIAMAYVGNSRPASGSEHHLSHYFEVVGIMKNEPYFLHGIDVCCSAVLTEKMREELIAAKAPQSLKAFDEKEWEDEIRRVYLNAADGVIELQSRLGWHRENRLPIYREKWDEIREILKEAPSSEELVGYLKTVELDMNDFEKQYGSEKISDAKKYAMDLKDRYTVLWLYNELAH